MRDLTKGSIYKNFIVFAIPLILSGILSQAYSVVNLIIAGRFLGLPGLAAVGATSQAIMLISSVFWGIQAGFGVYVANLFGAGDFKRMKNDIYNVFIVKIAVIILISIMAIALRGTIVKILKVDDEIKQEALSYFCIYMAGLFAIIMNNGFVQVMNAMGSSSVPFYMSVVSMVLNISGNILSVTVLKLGVIGIATSTVLSATVVDICYFLKLKGCFKELNVDKAKYKFSLTAITKSLRYTIPTSIQQTSMYISAFIMSPIVNGIGTSATAAYTVVLRVYDINAYIYQNSAKTLSNYSAQCVGAGKFDKIRKGISVGFLQGLIFVLPVIIACAVFARPINRLFFPTGFSGEALDYAVLFSRVYLPFVLFNLINNLFHSFFRGIAAMGMLMVATLIGSIARIVSSVILAGIYGMEGIFIGWVISWIVEAIFMVTVFIIKFSTTEKICRFAKRPF